MDESGVRWQQGRRGKQITLLLAGTERCPSMPLFFDPGRYVDVPFEATYNAAFAAMPKFWRDRLMA